MRRIQVEHPVTEEIPASNFESRQAAPDCGRGRLVPDPGTMVHRSATAIEVRINARRLALISDRHQSGTVTRAVWPCGAGHPHRHAQWPAAGEVTALVYELADSAS